MTDIPQIYKAVALQTECVAVNRCSTKSEAREVMEKSLARIRGQIQTRLTCPSKSNNVVLADPLLQVIDQSLEL